MRASLVHVDTTSPQPSCRWEPEGIIRRSQPVACKSLRHACMKVIKNSINVRSVLGILQFVHKYGHAIVRSYELENACLSFIRDSYRGVREEHGVEALTNVLGQETVAELEHAEQTFSRYRRLLRVQGNVVERSISYKEGDEVGKGIFPSNSSSVAGRAHRSYPYEWLLTGKQWPDDVDPTLRERFLEASRFVALFGMNYHAFAALPAWRQLMLKREALLF